MIFRFVSWLTLALSKMFPRSSVNRSGVIYSLKPEEFIMKYSRVLQLLSAKWRYTSSSSSISLLATRVPKISPSSSGSVSRSIVSLRLRLLINFTRVAAEGIIVAPLSISVARDFFPSSSSWGTSVIWVVSSMKFAKLTSNPSIAEIYVLTLSYVRGNLWLSAKLGQTASDTSVNSFTIQSCDDRFTTSSTCSGDR